MNLQDLLKDIIDECPVVEIEGISCDSRKVEHGDLFFAITGNKLKGSDFAKEAMVNGAAAIVCDEKIEDASVPCFVVEDIRAILSLVASRFYHNDIKNIVAVTGTNGKTSVAYFCMQLFEAMGEKTAFIGTLGVMDKNGVIADYGTTTPDAITIHKTLKDLYSQDYTAVAFEASSHGLEQNRLDNVEINAAGFTNLTRDHMDYHKTMTSYGNAKKRLFFDILSKDGIAVLNADSDFFEEIKENGHDVISYGHNSKVLNILSTSVIQNGQMLKLSAFGDEYDIILKLAGEFQIMNALCAAGLVIGCGFPPDKIIPALASLNAPAGRLDLAGELSNGAKVYIDYAHTPDALENALTSLRPFAVGQLQVLFGCGGDRDPGKREIMGQIAEKFADKVFITDDNPRTEDPETIRLQVLKGAPNKGQNAGDREGAIKYAIEQLGANDMLLIAGKGHEDYQEINGVKHPFDDKQQAIKVIENIKS